jgi:hypothetical protein
MICPRIAVPAALLAVFATGLACTPNASAERPADSGAPTTRSASTKPAATRAAAAAPKITPLFDGKSLKNWKPTEFGGEGDVSVDEGRIVVRSGATLSGITWVGGELPRSNYEIELDAMKLDGSDFFLGLTFPYKKECTSLILGGWGGGIVGLSSINGDDAANNETQTARDFPEGQVVPRPRPRDRRPDHGLARQGRGADRQRGDDRQDDQHALGHRPGAAAGAEHVSNVLGVQEHHAEEAVGCD